MIGLQMSNLIQILRLDLPKHGFSNAIFQRIHILIILALICQNHSNGDESQSLPEHPEATAGKESLLEKEDFFPIGVWLQDIANAPKYAAAGINMYVGLWKGPTQRQLMDLRRYRMPVICEPNEYGLKHKNNSMILAWMLHDEPDNAQSLGKGIHGYGPPIPPATIIEEYQRIRERDSSRPIFLNLGQGVAWDGWRGRGARTNHPEDYAEYVKGCDIASFDLYPGTIEHPDVAGKIWMVADGVTRLRKLAGDQKRVWNCIECTHVNNEKTQATPAEVRAEVWMSLIRGSRGIIYFAHQFKPKYIEAGLLADKTMLSCVTQTNRQIKELASVLNSPTVLDGVTVESDLAEVPVEALVKQYGKDIYIFAVPFRPGTTEASFRVSHLTGQSKVEVLGESRMLDIVDGKFHDRFNSWEVHLYRILDEAE
jgi:hypothetical protein